MSGDMIGSKKLASRHHDENGELWLVSYADMMTLLFGFFVILYSFSQVDQERLSSFGKEIAEAFGSKKAEKGESEGGVMSEARKQRALQLLVAVLNLGDDVNQGVEKIEKMASEAQARSELAKAVTAKMKPLAKDELKGIDVTEPDELDSVRIGINAKLLFEGGSAELLPEAKVRLRAIAGEISPLRDVVGLEIIGHTDARPPGKSSKFQSNFQLSAARAAAVAGELQSAGLEGRQIKVIGMGGSLPLFPETSRDGKVNEANMARNRRVEILVRRMKAPEGGAAR